MSSSNLYTVEHMFQ